MKEASWIATWSVGRSVLGLPSFTLLPKSHGIQRGFHKDHFPLKGIICHATTGGELPCRDLIETFYMNIELPITPVPLYTPSEPLIQPPKGNVGPYHTSFACLPWIPASIRFSRRVKPTKRNAILGFGGLGLRAFRVWKPYVEFESKGIS